MNGKEIGLLLRDIGKVTDPGLGDREMLSQVFTGRNAGEAVKGAYIAEGLKAVAASISELAGAVSTLNQASGWQSEIPVEEDTDDE